MSAELSMPEFEWNCWMTNYINYRLMDNNSQTSSYISYFLSEDKTKKKDSHKI